MTPRSRALSITAITLWSLGIGVVAAVTVVLLLVFLGSGTPEDASRLDAVRTASSVVVGTGGAAALLLAARRQRYVELDLEQKDHDSTERRVTELYGSAANQLGGDKAPVRLAGVYALERLAQDHPQHRQAIVNLLCAYLRMPYAPATTDQTDQTGTDQAREARQEREVRGAVQNVFEAHLRPVDEDGAALATFWPDIDLNLSGATLEWFWFRGCRVRSGVFRYAAFHHIAAVRDSEFTARSDFRDTTFLGTADLRNNTFGPGRPSFAGASFEGSVDFGTRTAGGPLDLTGVTASTAGEPRRWPAGWAEEPEPEPDGGVRVVRDGGPPAGG